MNGTPTPDLTSPVADRITGLTTRVTAVMPLVRTAFLVVLFLGTTGCSLVMSANATMTYALHHNMPLGIQWAPVGVLELAQIAGTVWWLSATRKRSRAGAILLVAGTAAVTAVMSQALYGWVGLIAPVGMVATIHAIASVTRTTSEVAEVPQPQPVLTSVDTGPVPAVLRSQSQWTDDELRESLRAWAADSTDPGPTVDAARNRYRIGTGRATRLLREVA